MLFKLSLKNIKKSIKDYSVYFFTLIFAVAMFYTFNSLDAQNSMLKLSSSKNEIAEALVVLLSYVSIFVSVILGFLIIYSNNFLIKRRKKEIGLYFTLGMSKQKASTILVVETLIVGIISLAIGLVCGIFLSQFTSIFTAKLFEVNLTSFKFVFSSSALYKTILYFGIIFALVMIFNIITLSRYKLIDLLNAGKKNEQVKVRNKYLTLITFILAVGLIGYAYYLLFNNALLMMDIKTIFMLVSGALGTFLLFFSMSGFLLKLFEHIKKIYYKNLNMFILKQVNNRINTTVISTTVICLMLLLTIGILSGSMSMANAFNTDMKENNLTDYTISANKILGYVNDNLEVEEKETNDLEVFEGKINNGLLDEYSKDYVLMHSYYDKDLHVDDMLTDRSKQKLISEYGSGLSFDFGVPVISESEYKKFMELTNQKYIDIEDNEYLLLCNVDFIIDAYSDFYNSKGSITINNRNLIPGSDNLIKTAIENYNSSGNDGVLVVSDNITNGLGIESIKVLGNYMTDDYEGNDDSFYNYIVKTADEDNFAFDFRSRASMEAASLGIKTIVTFIGLYLGITFAITSATVLAIGQLSESSDNKDRYKVLKQLGADNKMVKKSLFTQIGIAFGFPLIIALIHSYFGLKELNKLIKTIGNINLTSNIVLTALFIVVVYGGYFAITYLCSKNIIKED